VTRRRTEGVAFSVTEPATVVGFMDDLAAVHDGWINFQPEVRPEDEPPHHSGLSVLLAGVVHDVPVATWVPGKVVRDALRPDSIGIQHAVGARVLGRLTTAGVGLPEGWRVVQDHPRRGLIVAPGPGTDHATLLAWLLEAGTALSAVRLTGRWRAEVYLPAPAPG
jgi:hypothetical protein